MLQESPATLPLSPGVSSPAPGRVVRGLSAAPCWGVRGGGAVLGEDGRGMSRSGGWRGFWQSQQRRHARRDLRHAQGIAQGQGTQGPTITNMLTDRIYVQPEIYL